MLYFLLYIIKIVAYGLHNFAAFIRHCVLIYGLKHPVGSVSHQLHRVLIRHIKRQQGGVAKITGMPHVAANGSSVENHAILIAEQRALIDCLVKRSIIEYNRLSRYIASVRDCRMRMILSLRHIDGMSWTRIAMRIGGGNTADSIRMAHQRFLQKH